MTDHKEPVPCGGCGCKDPAQRCIGCGHPFFEIAAGSAPKASAVPEQSQSVQPSIDTPEFRGIMLAASTAWPTKVKQIKEMTTYIDSRLAEAWELGRKFQYDMADTPLRERAEAAEAKLAVILKTKEDTNNLPD